MTIEELGALAEMRLQTRGQRPEDEPGLPVWLRQSGSGRSTCLGIRLSAYEYGGESGIRTHEGLHPAGFQDRCLQPLGHLSAVDRMLRSDSIRAARG